VNSCPDDDNLRRLLAGDLDDALDRAVTAHLQWCERCQQQLETLTAVAGKVDSTVCERGLGRLRPLLPPAEAVLPSPDGAIGATWPAVPGYEILKELGRGGMGVVYLARHVRLRRLVALKMVMAERATAETLVRFAVEGETLGRLQHPNIVQIHEVATHDGCPYFALEYVAGGNLEQRLAGRPLPLRHAADLVEVVARAVHHAHQAGIVHRDLKPANVLLCAACGLAGKSEEGPAKPQAARQAHDDVVPKVTDFGLARRLDADLALTRTGCLLGTPSYMAPEQAAGLGKEVGPAADVYALGAILYECLTGRPPFTGESALDLLYRVIREDPIAPTLLRPECPRDLETIALKCLAKDQGKRYSSAAALADDLHRFLAGEAIAARPPGVVERSARWVARRPAAAALLALGATALLALLGGWAHFTHLLQQERNTARQSANDARTAQEIAEGQRDRAQRLWVTAQLLRVQAVCDHDPARGLALLEDPDACPAALRDFAWGYFYRLCKCNRLTLPVGRPAHAVAFSGDGQSVAVGTADGAVELLDVASGRSRKRWAAHRGPVLAVAFAAGSVTLASAGHDGTVRLWACPSGKPVKTLTAHKGPATCLAFAADGRTLATGGRDANVRVWEWPTGRLRSTFRNRCVVQCLAFSPNGSVLAAGGGCRPVPAAPIAPLARRRRAERGHRPNNFAWPWCWRARRPCSVSRWRCRS
jgi:hypothetical protein